MPWFKPEHALVGDYLYTDWDEDAINSLLQLLTPQNARLDLQVRSISPCVAGCTYLSKYYDYRYGHLTYELFGACSLCCNHVPMLHCLSRRRKIRRHLATREQKSGLE